MSSKGEQNGDVEQRLEQNGPMNNKQSVKVDASDVKLSQDSKQDGDVSQKENQEGPITTISS